MAGTAVNSRSLNDLDLGLVRRAHCSDAYGKAQSAVATPISSWMTSFALLRPASPFTSMAGAINGVCW